MKTLRQFINETFANEIGAASKLPKNTNIDEPYIKYRLNNAKKFNSNSPDHIIYHIKEANGKNQYHWVNRKTGNVDFRMETTSTPGKLPNEEFHSNILIQSRENGPPMGITAFHDLWSGRLGHYGITVHDNQSEGAVRLHNNLREKFGNKVLYHTYNPKTGKAEHLTRGVAASPATPGPLFKAIKDTQIVAMMAPKNRPPLAKPKMTVQ